MIENIFYFLNFSKNSNSYTLENNKLKVLERIKSEEIYDKNEETKIINRHSMFVENLEEKLNRDSNIRISDRSLSRSLPDLVLMTKKNNEDNKINSQNLKKKSIYSSELINNLLDYKNEMCFKKDDQMDKTSYHCKQPLPILNFEKMINLVNMNIPNTFFNNNLFLNEKISLENSRTKSSCFDVFGCFIPIWNTIGKTKLKTNEWEIPFDSIRILEWISSGSQGVVFKGCLNDQIIAVKKVREKSETEIKHLKKLKHVNVIKFIGVCTISPCYCVVMEYCSYGPLSDILITKKNKIEPELVFDWANQIANGMNYLHTNEIIHRDLKSANVLISKNNILKISDFGTSKQRNEQSTKMTFAGTYAWMAPEVIKNEKCSEKIDIWSFGVLLWELLTSETPYHGIESSRIIIGVGYNNLKLPIPLTFPDGLKLLMQMCWSIQPQNRPSFNQILMHLKIYCGEFMEKITIEEFNSMKLKWSQEIEKSLAFMKNKNYSSTNDSYQEIIEKRKIELDHARDIKHMYEQKLNKVNELYDEVNTLLSKLKNHENELKKLEIFKFYKSF